MPRKTIFAIGLWLVLLTVWSVMSTARSEPALQEGVAEQTFSPAAQNITTPVRKCINLGGALEAKREGDWGYRIRAQDLRLIAKTGFDTIRLPVKYSAHTAAHAPYTIKPALLRRTDEIIRTSLDLGLKVILDVHHFNEFMQNPEAEMPLLRSIWAQLSAHYADWPGGLIFEMLNEAHANVTVEKSNRINAQLLKIIRERNPERWVVAGSGNWGSLSPLEADAKEKFMPPTDRRLITTFHYYDPFEFTHQGVPFLSEPQPVGIRFGSAADKNMVAEHMREARDFQSRTGHPLLLGEFGVYRDVPESERAKWTRHVREQAEVNGIGWCYWEWATGFRMYDQDSGKILPQIKSALFD